jgi:AraC family transcriptional regulator of adaptative response/methylated-DNA-[protein]-cysteine methyltransferase
MPTDQEWISITQRTRSEVPFLYGVRTTGIFCRTTCPSRRPRRENVVIFDSVEEAVTAGFRACMKCTPERAATPIDRAIVDACAMMEAAEEPPSLAEIARTAGLSPSHFHRQFRKGTGMTPKEYLDTIRRRRLQNALGENEPVSSALYGAGFGSPSRLYEQSDRQLGMTPGRYRKGGKGTEIRYATANCTLGWVVAAATEKGICAIELADTEAAAEQALETRFPQASLRRDEEALGEWLPRIVAHVDDPRAGFTLPLDIAGTAFQQRVWKALRDIQPGSTTTYQGLAEAIGSPSAVRAVAGACAANPVAIVIPCHRVRRSNGESGGYRWGIERKLQLLEREARGERETGGTTGRAGLRDNELPLS